MCTDPLSGLPSVVITGNTLDEGSSINVTVVAPQPHLSKSEDVSLTFPVHGIQSIAAFEAGSFLPLPSREAVERSIGKSGIRTISIVYFKGVEFAVKWVSGHAYRYTYVYVYTYMLVTDAN